jgi:hypothetical protein
MEIRNLVVANGFGWITLGSSDGNLLYCDPELSLRL